MTRLAIVATHPIQYYSPWFRFIAANARIETRVFYLWDFGVRNTHDPGFHRDIVWDVPLLDGYDSEFVPNTAKTPGTKHFFGLRNPTLSARLLDWRADAALLLSYNHASTMRSILTWPKGGPKLLFRGDSHRLAPRATTAREWLRRRAIAAIFRRFDAVLSVGCANREYFLKHGVPPQRIFRAPHCVDNDRFIAAREAAEREARLLRAELAIPMEAPVALYAGRFLPLKWIDGLLRAFVAAAPPHAHLVLAGDGPERASLEALAATHPNVHLLPFQNQSAMPRTLCLGDVLVLPSRTEETWGLVLNEAMCMQRAVIASDLCGGAHDLIEHGENGLRIRANDFDALRDALRHALSDRERLRRWGARGAQIVERFSYRSATEGLLEALRALGLEAEWRP